MNFYAVLLFLLFFGPILIKDIKSNYFKKAPLIVNFVFALFVFQIISTDIYQDIKWFFEHKFFFNQKMTDDTINNSNFHLFKEIFNVLDFLLSNYILYILVLLGVRKQKSRILLIKILPVIGVFLSIGTIIEYLNIESAPNLNIFIPFILISIGFSLLIIYFIYTRDFMKSIFKS